ncbi:MFS transporter [Undibacterium sp. TJN19]|uniref:MFS transporter n=1 Tax=Undibacterium sp. TJN19 TaxID=3413055 RepID=UPI003BF3E4EF
MSRDELRSGASLASIFALRMLGLFLILPVFAIHAKTLPDGDNSSLVGLAMGIYGLSQAFGQIPFGIASDKYGRKRIIVIGLILFAIGAFVAAGATTVVGVIIGRAIQGAGAISAAITALIADSTREEHRTKAMAMVGGSIGLTFAFSLVAAPLLYQSIGMGGIFAMTGILSLLAIVVVLFVTPDAPAARHAPVALSVILKNRELMRLNYGVFALHLTQMAMFVVVPAALVQYADLPVTAHWKVYLPVMFASFIAMLPAIFIGEKYGKMKQVFVGAISLLLVVEIGFWQYLQSPAMLVGLLFAFFIAFNILEACQPSLVSRIAPPAAKGAALGVYNTLQAVGLFCGGAIGGWLKQALNPSSVFVLSALLTAVWLIIAINMPDVAKRSKKASPVQA